MGTVKQPPKEWHVYALKDPRTNEIRYVGCTWNPKSRLRSHMRITAKDRTPRAAWIADLLSNHLTPLMEILETTSGDYQAAEKRWIVNCKCDGHHLTNSTDGGNGTVGYHFTAADRAKVAAASRARKRTPEETAKAAASHRALNRKLSDENKAIVSKTHKGRDFLTPEARARVTAALTGRPTSEATRAKFSAIHKGKTVSPETRAKLANVNTGKKQSAEARAKMVAAWAERKAARSSFPEMSRPQK